MTPCSLFWSKKKNVQMHALIILSLIPPLSSCLSMQLTPSPPRSLPSSLSLLLSIHRLPLVLPPTGLPPPPFSSALPVLVRPPRSLYLSVLPPNSRCHPCALFVCPRICDLDERRWSVRRRTQPIDQRLSTQGACRLALRQHLLTSSLEHDPASGRPSNRRALKHLSACLCARATIASRVSTALLVRKLELARARCVNLPDQFLG